ncbi:MAG: NUDIX hydrolase [Acidimicrobiia bacterium]|nr:NUDIX hydrolase [Acidimicrobiia bacterium]
MTRLQELIDLLRSYDPPPAEAGARQSMLALAAGPDDPFSRDLFAPGHFTASGFVLSTDRTALLMVHHKRLDRWLQPGGHIDPTGERVIEASIREIEEETGIEAIEPVGTGIFDIDIHDIPAKNQEPPHLHFDVRFLFHATNDAIEADDEVHDAAWVPLGEVAQRTHDASVLRGVAKLVESEQD